MKNRGALVASACFLQLVGTSTGSTLPDEISYKFTARKFLFAGCLTAEELLPFWPPQGVGTNVHFHPTYDRNTTDFAENCPPWGDVTRGVLRGHPDFQADGDMYASGSSGFGRPGQSNVTVLDRERDPVGDCSLTKIVEDDLVPLPSGIMTLQYYDDPVYDRNGVCKTAGGQLNEHTTTGVDSFNQWYQDDLVVNRRVGFELTLKLDKDSQTYQYSDDKFFPLNGFTRCTVNNDTGSEDCSNGGRFWELTQVEQGSHENGGNTFGFTTEHHSFFQYNGNETFSFAGDDDVWVFINDRMAIDLGGLHSPYSVRVSLDDVKENLGITEGGIYSFSMFHAERHTYGSNFFITTTLFENCNVLKSGSTKVSLDTLPSNLFVQSGSRFGNVDGNAGFINNDKEIVLTSSTKVNAASFVYAKSQVNTKAGFQVSFEFTISPTAGSDTGFAFVLHRRPGRLDDLNGGSSGHLGFRYLTDSVILAFDFCKDRSGESPQCKDHEISLRYGSSSTSGSPFSIQKSKWASLIQRYKDGFSHSVSMVYYKEPAWIEVYVDDSLYLIEKDVDLQSILGGSDAYVGFTAGTGNIAADTIIKSWTVSTVVVDPLATVLAETNSTETKEIIGDGSTPTTFTLRTRDRCNNNIQNGGNEGLAVGVLIPQSNTTASSQRRLADYIPETATVLDNLDGSYGLSFQSKQIGATFTLVSGFGNCVLQLNATNADDAIVQGEVTPEMDEKSASCWVQIVPNAAVAVPPPPAPPSFPPTVPPSIEQPQGLPEEVVTGLGIGSGILFIFGGAVIFFMVRRYRDKWEREKHFVDKGKLVHMDKDVDYQTSTEMDLVARQLMDTSLELQSQRAKMGVGKDLEAEIDALAKQKQEISDQVRMMKQRKQQESNRFSSKLRFSMFGGQNKKRFSRNAAPPLLDDDDF